MHFDAWTLWYLFLVGVFLPFVVVKSALRPPAAMPSLGTRIKRTLFMELFLAGIALLAGRQTGVELFNSGTLSSKVVVFSLAIIAVALLTIPLRARLLSQERRNRLLSTRPQAPRDLGWWLVVSLFAAVAEEIAYRGVLFLMLLNITGNWWPAALICALVFAVSHANQGWMGMATVGVIALCLQALVLFTGALYLPMAVHFTYDLLAGVVYMVLRKQFMGAPVTA